VGWLIARRLLSAVPVLLVVAVTIFLIIHLTPGDPAATMLGPEADPESVADLRRHMGLDQPLIVQFFQWFGALLVGDLGDSVFLGVPVTEAIASHLGPTLTLALLAEVIAIAIAVPAGILAARRRGRPSDQAIMAGTLVGTSVPSFLVGLLLVLLFAVTIKAFPAGGYVDPAEDLIGSLRFLVLPALALALGQAALIARMTRASMLEVFSHNYIKTAKAKGATAASVIYKHALRNASIPVLTVIGQSVGLLISGSVVIETVFNIPGLGQLIINSITRRDYPIIQGVVLVTALLYILVNLIVDIVYGLVDPRVRING
jgi:peptide/nickel transport system permease protein